MSFINFGEFLDISLFFFWDSSHMYDRLFDIVPQLLGILFYSLFFFLSLCVSVWVISVDIYSVSLFLSSAVLSLLMSP